MEEFNPPTQEIVIDEKKIVGAAGRRKRRGRDGFRSEINRNRKRRRQRRKAPAEPNEPNEGRRGERRRAGPLVDNGKRRGGLIESFVDGLKQRASKRLVIIGCNVAAIALVWFIGGDLQTTDVALILVNVVSTVSGFKWRESYNGFNSSRFRVCIANTITVLTNRLLPVPMSAEMISAISALLTSFVFSDSITPTKRTCKHQHLNTSEDSPDEST